MPLLESLFVKTKLASGIKRFPIDNVIIFGASIMDQTSSGTNQQAMKDLYALKGANVNVYDRATSGDDTTAMRAKLPAIITEFQDVAERTLIEIHWGGNNVSREGPYPGGATTMEADCRAMLQDLKAAGFKIALSDITYRLPPSHQTSEYNSNIMQPLIEEFADIPLSLYKLSFDNQDDWFEPDGVHPSLFGEDLNRNYLVNSTYIYFSNLGELPEPVVWENVLLEFGQANVYPDGSNKLNASSTTLSVVKNTDLTVVPNSIITLSGAEGHSTQGRGNVNDPTDESLTLTNNAGLTSYVYVLNASLFVDFSQANLIPTATYTIGFTASRNAADVRNNDVLIDGQTQVINSTASPAEIITFTGITGADLMSGGVTVSPTTTGYVYISMIQVTKE